MAIQLGSAYGKVALDVKGLLDAVRSGKAGMLSMAAAGEQIGAGMKRAGQAMTVGLTLPILAAGAASIKAASNFEETKNKAVVVFGDMADSVVANADRAATALGVSKTQYLDYASSIGAALTAGGLGIKETTALAEQAVKHFADLASFHNARVEDVAVAWQSAIRGQYEPIQRYFPFITDSYMKTYGIANGLVDANTKNLTANQRAMILNAIALDSKLNPALNDFAETSNGLANSSRIMQAQLQDAAVTLGQNLLPMALQVVMAFNKLLTSFNNLSPFQQKMVLGFLGIVAAAGPVLTILGTLVSTISSLIGIGTALSGVGISISTITAGLGAAVPAAAAVGTALLPVLLILGAIIATVALLYVAWRTNFLGMRENLAASVKIWRALWAGLMAFLRGDTDAAFAHLTEAANAFRERFTQIFGGFSGFVQNWSNFLNMLRTMLQRARDYIANAFTNVNWAQIGKYITLGIANGLLLGLPALLAIVVKVAASVLTQIKKSLGIKSPSTEAMKLGAFTAQGFALGMQSMRPEDITRALTKPITQNNNSQSQTIVQNFAGGVTLKQVRDMLTANNEDLMRTMIGALNG